MNDVPNEIELKLLLDGKQTTATLTNVDKLAEAIFGKTKSVGTSITNWGNAVNGTNESLEAVNQQMSALKKEQQDVTAQASKWGMIATGIQSATQSITQFTSSVKELVGDSVKAAAQQEVLRSSFQGTTEDLEMFKKATAGTVSEANLIKLSNQATALGLTLQQQAIFFSLAEDAADQFGGTVEAGMEGIIRASEGSTKAISQLGIQKKEFEERTKELAKAEGDSLANLDAEAQKRIRLQAIIELSGQTLDDVSKKQKDNNDLLEAASVDVEEARIKLGAFILQGLSPLLRSLDENNSGLKAFITNVIAIGGTIIGAIPLVVQLYSAKKLFSSASMISASAVSAETTAIEANTIAKAANSRVSLGLLGKAGLITAVGFAVWELTQNINENTKAVKANREEANKKYPNWNNSGFGANQNFEKGKTQTEPGKVNLGGFLSRNIIADSASQMAEKQTKKVFELRNEVKELIESLDQLDETQIKQAESIRKSIEAKEKIISKITGEKDSTNELTDAIKKQKKEQEEALKLEERKSEVAKGYAQRNEIDTFKTKIETEVSPAIKPASTDSSDVIKQRLLDANKNINAQIAEEEKKFDELMSRLQREQDDKKVDELSKELETSRTKIDILNSANKQILDAQKDFTQKWLEEEQKLADLKVKFIIDEKQRGEQEAFDKFINAATYQQINSALIAEEQNYQNIKSEMKALEYQGDADAVQKKWELLQKELEISNQRKNILKSEQNVIQEKAKQGVLAATQEYDVKQSLGVQLNKLANETIRRIIAEAVATQVAKALAFLPFPFNAIAAPLAGLAIQAAMEKIIPKFESGAVDINGRLHTRGGELVEIEGGESVINRRGTSQNKRLLQMINAGEKFNVVNNKAAIYNKIFSTVPASTAVNNYLSANLMNGFDSLSRTFVNTIDKQTERLEAIERNVKLSLVEFDQKYQDYKSSQSYMSGS